MHLTRAGYNMLVAVWLFPLILCDFWGNTAATGAESDYFYYKMMADGMLLAYAIFQMVGRPATASRATATSRTQDHTDEVVGFENLGAAEYIYCAILVIYAGVNWYGLHAINKEATGIVSIITMLWSFVSLGVGLLSAIQFYHLKSGKIVQLKQKIVA